MLTIDRININAPIEQVMRIASDVERWPDFLGHYRWVKILERNASGGVVEMAAWRHFGPVGYPTWWVSEMEVLPERHAVRYRHVKGITRGMDVRWELQHQNSLVQITITHKWPGPDWPVIGAVAANWVIGPIFIHNIASKTLAGVKRRAESS